MSGPTSNLKPTAGFSVEHCLSLHALQVFDFDAVLAAAELGSFRKASIRLGIGQTAISRRVQKVEEALGVSLFERRPTGVRLTRAGAQFTAYARNLVADFEEAAHAALAAGTGDAGRLKLGIIASLSSGILRTIIAEFKARHPEVTTVLLESERRELLTMLSHRKLDAIFALGTFEPDQGESFVVAREGLYLALAEQHRLAARLSLSWPDVLSEHFIVSAQDPGPDIHDYITKQLASAGRRPHVTRHHIAREAVMSLVGLGLGVALAPDHWRGVGYPHVVFRRIGEEHERLPFSLIWRAENDNPALRRFLSLARIEAQRDVTSTLP